MINNKHALAFINSVFLTLFLISIIETHTYLGFFFNHLTFVVGMSIILSIIFSYLFFLKIHSTKFMKTIPYCLAIFFVFLYFISNFLEKLIYTNYVFSHFHIHPSMLLMCAFFITCIFFLNGDKKNIRMFIYFLPFVILGQYVVANFDLIKKTKPIFIVKNIGLSYERKMQILIDKLPYDFISFVKANTSDNSSILIPPQSFPWEKTSNIAYLRYFLFPRILINGNEKDPKIKLDDVDFILIDYGETYVSQYGYTNGWPKFDVNGEYILYWNPETGETLKDEKGVYKYNENDKYDKWGLIKIKH